MGKQTSNDYIIVLFSSFGAQVFTECSERTPVLSCFSPAMSSREPLGGYLTVQVAAMHQLGDGAIITVQLFTRRLILF